jgi:hypothetical protein
LVRISSDRRPALDPEVLSQFARACLTISDNVVDDRGFVPVRRLLEKFRATLVARPLLVEGMIASQRSSDGTAGHQRWLVLVDSEKYSFSEQEVKEETSERALPERLRFTIAHELAHSLAFRVSEFGIRLRDIDMRRSGQDLVEALEDETDSLSSLLLISQRALSNLLRGRKEAPDANEWAAARRAMGVSRPVLISRLRSLSASDPDGLRSGYGLRNVAIGVAEWGKDGCAALRRWPIFASFDRNIYPSFLFDVAHQDYVSASDVFADRSFALCGGARATINITSDAGTEKFRNASKMLIECSSEDASRKAGARSLFVVRVRAS